MNHIDTVKHPERELERLHHLQTEVGVSGEYESLFLLLVPSTLISF